MLKFLSLSLFFSMAFSSAGMAAELSLQSGESALIRANVDTEVTCNGGNSETPSIACGPKDTEASCSGSFVNDACGKPNGARGWCTKTGLDPLNRPICKCL